MAIITISRGTFSGGKKLAECVAETLGYKCVALEVLAEAAKRYGVALEKLEHALRDKPGIFERMSKERLQALAFIGAELLREVKDERTVYHGNAGQFFLRDVPHVLRVRITADMEYRIRAAMAERHYSREEAVKFIERADAIRARWAKFMFHEDLMNPLLYDLMINLQRTSVEGACGLVCDLARGPEFQPTPESMAVLDDLCLKAHLKSKVMADRSIAADGLIIEVRSGTVILRGAPPEEMEKVRRMLNAEPGIRGILMD